MARISTYDRDLVISREDILIGTDSQDSSITKNYSVGSLIDFISLSSGGVVDTNYYLSAITANQSTGVVTFTVNGTDNQTLTLGTAAFSASTDFAASNISFNTAQVVSANDITAYYLNVDGNGLQGQLLQSDGDGSFTWVNAASLVDTNNYVTNIEINGSQLVFRMQGNVSDPTVTLGSAAFESVTSIVNQVSNQISLDDIDTTFLGDLATLDKVGANQISTDAITALKIKDGVIGEKKLAIANNPTSGYVLTSDGADGFSWTANASSNYYLTSVTQTDQTLTFNLGGGFAGTDPTFTFGSAAFANVSTTETDRNAANVPKANHTHVMAHITDAGSVATLNSIGTSDIDNNAVTAAKLSPAVGTDGQVLSLSGGNLAWVAGQAGASNFIALSDTPASMGTAGQILKVNSGANALEFSNFNINNIGQITSVNTGTAGKVLAIDANNYGASGSLGLKWVDTSQVGATTFTALTDTPSSLGTANQLLAVNQAANAVEFVTINGTYIQSGTIQGGTNGNLATNTVTFENIANATITGDKINNNTVTQGNLATNSVGTNEIIDLNVTSGKIAEGAVIESKIANLAITESKINTDAVTTAKILNSAVTSAKILDGAITLAKLDPAINLGGTNTYTDWETTNNTKIDWYVNGSNEMQLLANGTLHVDGDVVAYSSTIASDKNLKNNITNIDNPIEKVKQLNGVTFNWKKNDKESGGVIAQEVQQVLPSLVSEVTELNGEGSHLAVDYNGIIGLLIETVKEQQNQIDDLKARIEA